MLNICKVLQFYLKGRGKDKIFWIREHSYVFKNIFKIVLIIKQSNLVKSKFFCAIKIMHHVKLWQPCGEMTFLYK